MTDFRFRAAAALDLRRRQETTLSTSLAVAEAEFRAAEAHASQAEADRRTAQEHLVTAERRGSDMPTLVWHRNWIVRLANDLAARRAYAETLAQTVREVEAQWRLARQRRLALERMRDRALRRHEQEQQRQEIKVIDELARLRFVMADIWRDDS